MGAKFPFSMENIPRQRSFGCMSLKFGSILSALIVIIYSVLSLAQCTAALTEIGRTVSTDDPQSVISLILVIMFITVHAVTLALTALMLVGTLREKPHQIRPWVVWTSIQVIMYLLLFVFWTTMSMIGHFGTNALLAYVVEFACLLIRFYMLMLVGSYYKQLEEELFDGEKLKTLTNSDVWYNSA